MISRFPDIHCTACNKKLEPHEPQYHIGCDTVCRDCDRVYGTYGKPANEQGSVHP